ncbi:MAG: IS3 family transposase [Acidimicrobiia bacterium]|nr:IS3 family transposase [Acidimicrobiia bacterium]
MSGGRVGWWRPTAPPSANEVELREPLRDFARAHPRLGWRKAHVVACREALVTNPKRTRRIWRDEGLRRLPQRKAKRHRQLAAQHAQHFAPQRALSGARSEGR